MLQRVFALVYILWHMHRRTPPPPPPPIICQIPIFGQKTCNIRANPLDFRASNGEKIRATDLSPLNETGPVHLWAQA